MADPFGNYARGLDSPGREHFEITPSDTLDIPTVPRVLKILTSGTLAVRDTCAGWL